MTQTDPMLLRLKKTVLILACVFLCLLCVVTGLLLSIVIDVRHQVNTLREQTGRVAQGMEHLEQALAKWGDPTAARGALAKGIRRLPVDIPAPPAANEKARVEIAHLLECIGRPELRYEYEGKQRPAEWVQMKLSGKAALFGSEFASAEDFIDRVAAQTGEGAVYYVTDKEGKKAELQGWLRDRLQEYRSSEKAQ